MSYLQFAQINQPRRDTVDTAGGLHALSFEEPFKAHLVDIKQDNIRDSVRAAHEC